MDEESLRADTKWMMKGINHNDFKDMLADLSLDTMGRQPMAEGEEINDKNLHQRGMFDGFPGRREQPNQYRHTTLV